MVYVVTLVGYGVKLETTDLPTVLRYLEARLAEGVVYTIKIVTRLERGG